MAREKSGEFGMNLEDYLPTEDFLSRIGDESSMDLEEMDNVSYGAENDVFMEDENPSREKSYVSPHRSRAMRRLQNRKHKLYERGSKGVTRPWCMGGRWEGHSFKENDAPRRVVFRSNDTQITAFPFKELVRGRHEYRAYCNNPPEFRKKKADLHKEAALQDWEDDILVEDEQQSREMFMGYLEERQIFLLKKLKKLKAM